MLWIALLVILFLVFGLRRSRSRRSIATMVVAVAAVLLLWYTQMSTSTA